VSRRILIFPLILGLCCLSKAQDDTRSDVSLNGLWNLLGRWDAQPYLTMALAVHEGVVYGEAHFGVTCSNRNSGEGISFYLKGNIAEDGSFLLTTDRPSSDFIEAEIKGKVPAGGATSWPGNLRIRNPAAKPNCTFEYAQDFIAKSYPSLTGVFKGTIGGKSLGTGLTVTLRLRQGNVSTDPNFHGAELRYFTALSATMVVSGYRIYTATADLTLPHSLGTDRVLQDGFLLEFPTDDGPTVTLTGRYDDLTGTVLGVNYFTSGNGGGGGKLTRQ
jgi:hypothetical protein